MKLPMSFWLLLLMAITTADGNKGISPKQKGDPWYKVGLDQLKDRLGVKTNNKPAHNVILFIGDGMGLSTLTAARIRDGQLRGETGEENMLSFEKFPWVALSKTYSTDSQVSDSACTATAILTGVKTNFGNVGVNDEVQYQNCSSYSPESDLMAIPRLAENSGMSTGLVTNMKVTHATPASSYAHSAGRYWEADSDMKDEKNCAQPDIAKQLLSIPGKGFRVVLGGGRSKLSPNNVTDPEDALRNGSRLDGRNLIDEWVQKYDNSKYVWNAKDFNAVDPAKTEYLLGLFQPGNMNYEADRANDIAGEPSLEEMTEKAIKILKKNPKGFFLLVEGGLIDYGHHDNNAYRALSETIMLDKAVKKALDLVNLDETLIIVTADHSHSFTIGGYALRGSPILGVDKRGKETLKPEDNKSFTTLSYANGPGGLSGSRPEPQNTEDKEYVQQAIVKMKYSGHGGEDVGIFAQGPQAHLFGGIVEENYIFQVMDHALCLSESKQGTCSKPEVRGGEGVQLVPPVISTLLAVLLASVMMLF